jgi:hypothetical protein
MMMSKGQGNVTEPLWRCDRNHSGICGHNYLPNLLTEFPPKAVLPATATMVLKASGIESS